MQGEALTKTTWKARIITRLHYEVIFQYIVAHRSELQKRSILREDSAYAMKDKYEGRSGHQNDRNGSTQAE